ncbi:hypothetical protein BKA59DRAFT_239939 [Fusarium tricinctum]|jgi:hypothetical protein|uniref:Uncharacterized protein n=1 Tax=Fusarium tricinctum TaxID=61284 RepID=A0A8K0W7Y0_9HYPO|nr:hypothetical protein BKA59DRAFT_239939 [Fusarium tricinctum]
MTAHLTVTLPHLTDSASWQYMSLGKPLKGCHVNVMLLLRHYQRAGSFLLPHWSLPPSKLFTGSAANKSTRHQQWEFRTGIDCMWRLSFEPVRKYTGNEQASGNTMEQGCASHIWTERSRFGTFAKVVRRLIIEFVALTIKACYRPVLCCRCLNWETSEVPPTDDRPGTSLLGAGATTHFDFHHCIQSLISALVPTVDAEPYTSML